MLYDFRELGFIKTLRFLIDIIDVICTPVPVIRFIEWNKLTRAVLLLLNNQKANK